MRKLRNIIIALLTSTATLPVCAQRIVPVNKHVSCGQVLFNSPYTVDFEMTSEGKRHISIDSIDSGCECIELDYPREIKGGKDFKITARFNARMLGHFYKYILVYADGCKEPVELSFSGVVKTEVTDYGRSYPYEINGIRTDFEELEFDDVKKGDVLQTVVHVMNPGIKTVEPNIMHLPSYLKAEATPEKLKPEAAGEIRITLNSDELHDYGLSQSTVYMGTTIGEKISPEKSVPVSVVLLPPTENLTEAQRLNAPHISLSSDTLDLGSFDGKAKKHGTIEITNTGKSILSIKSMQLFSAGIQIKLNKQRIEPGKKARLKITAVREQLKKKGAKPRILMITDDPDKSKIIIHIKIK